jgi:hypothetical protein
MSLDVWDAVGLAGATMVLSGLWWLHPALAVVGAGAGLITLALWGAKRWASSHHSSGRDGTPGGP